ncbi:MAG: amidohydrolase family protein, partial [Deltaproteobacteria bacterium]|nr:amidohydrolase family protein [Deltaproteobacteria bacterium]
MNLLIKAGLVLTFDDQGTVLEGGEILIEDGAIGAVGSRVNLEGRPPARVIDARDALVMPGLVNAHTHSSENLRKGCGDRGSLAEWLPKVIVPLDALDPEANRIAALLGCGAMLRSGTTTVLDHFRRLPLQGANVDAVAEAYEKAGIRAVLAPTVRDRALYEPSAADRRAGRAPRQMEEPLGQPADAQLALCEEAIRKWHGRAGRLQIFLGPSGPQRCSDDLLQDVRELAEKYDVGVHTHLAETRWQGMAGKTLYGTTLTAHLDELGLLSSRLSVAHAIWLERDDIRRLGRARASAVHNPVSNLKLGSGIAKVAQMRRAGVNVALGSDGAASNDSQEMFEVVKLAAILS